MDIINLNMSLTKSFKDKVKFKFEDHEYSQHTYKGRFMHFLDVVNPKRFFISNARIKEAQDKVRQFKIKEEVSKNLNIDIYISQEEVQQLIENKKIVGSTIHPDTGERIPFYFRMSGFIIFNAPILFGVLMTAQTPLNIMFFQLVNQSYNAGLNYGNRNASSPYTSKGNI
jgi:CxxC motif-containing protein